MKETIDRWGERTICRVEESGSHESGLELILRLRGDFRSIEREEIILFLEKVIGVLNRKKTDVTGSVRIVSSGKSREEIKPGKLSDIQRTMLVNVVTGLHDRLTRQGQKELRQFLKELPERMEHSV